MLAPAEKQWLLRYLETTDTSELSDVMLRELYNKLAQQQPEDKGRTARMLHNIHEQIGIQPVVRRMTRVRTGWLAAACMACLLLGAAYWLFKSNREQPLLAGRRKQADSSFQQGSKPVGNKALLTLADGSTIVLDSAQDGNIAQQGSTRVFKFNGRLDYTSAVAGADSALFNSLSTPRGGQYAVTLPDGTRVWLNAESSIRFPTGFVGTRRRVEISGEAYFEVAKNKEKPFVVRVNEAEIQVLGTHFNVMAYREEPALKTTLLEGSVRFTSGGSASLLQPGQQLKMSNKGDIHISSNIDVEDVIAWKNGLFHFEGTDIKAVMRQLARWYNVKVIYAGTSPNESFHADIPRSATLPEALKALELTEKVQFAIEGETVIVKPR